MFLSRLLPHLAPASVLWSGIGGRHGLCRDCARVIGRVQWLHEKSSTSSIVIKDGMTLSELADSTRLSSDDVRAKLKRLGAKIKKNDSISLLDSERLILSLGHQPIHNFFPGKQDPQSLIPRPPVVAVMGHVDHGKTTLLDSLRQTAVAASEAGGITQHIGAFSVCLSSGSRLTFLDTPGHAAFSEMRARGANATDMVVLVVAADDGVKEQTIESIKMIEKANIPMVVAINKCDKHKKDIARVKRELLQNGVVLEEYHGEVQAVEISALKKEGLDALEEALLALADISNIKGDPKGPVQGVIIETKMDKGLGSIATVIIQHGTLKIGDFIVAGKTWCKVKTMQNENGKSIKSAPPSSPVVTMGWKDLPAVGELCQQVESEKVAKLSSKKFSLNADCRTSLNDPTQSNDDIITVPLIVKGDVTGSVEALMGILNTRQPEQFKLKVVQSGVGPILDSDMDMAIYTKGMILAFGVNYSKSIASMAEMNNIKILSSNVIYTLLDLLKDELEAMLSPLDEEEILGVARVIKVFKMRGSKPCTIGGSVVEEGKMLRSASFRVLRDGKVTHEGELSGMRNNKQDIESAKKDTEVGIRFSKDFDFEEGDKVVCYRIFQSQPTLTWDLGF